MNNFLTVIKGFIIGIAKIIPGVSGSVLALSLGVYERVIDIVSNIKNIKLKAVDFNKKHQEKINKFLATKKKLVKPNLNASNIDNNNGRIPVLSNVRECSAMQNLEKPLNINTFILCRNCGNRNNITNKICAKCGKKL